MCQLIKRCSTFRFGPIYKITSQRVWNEGWGVAQWLDWVPSKHEASVQSPTLPYLTHNQEAETHSTAHDFSHIQVHICLHHDRKRPSSRERDTSPGDPFDFLVFL